jgi:hypothetical protein
MGAPEVLEASVEGPDETKITPKAAQRHPKVGRRWATRDQRPSRRATSSSERPDIWAAAVCSP